MTEILNKYTAGQTTLEETNAALASIWNPAKMS